MAKNVAVVVGLRKCGNLVTLPGALLGAEQFSVWAKEEGFEVHSFSDKTGRPVSAHEIYTTIDGIVTGGVERLFLFFAGHGAIHSANIEFWLLSDWEHNPNEAINVSLSLANAKTCGIQHLAVFADACRTTVGKKGIGLGGQSIFPSLRINNVPTQWDQFFATKLGDPSQEVPDSQIEKAFGVFTKCLLSGLAGEQRAATSLLAGGPSSYAVTAQSLVNFIEKRVPTASGDIDGGVVQFPEAVSGSRAPNNIYCWVGQERIDGWGSAESETSRGTPDATTQVDNARTAEDARAQHLANEIVQQVGRVSFETSVGLTVIGAEVVEAVVTGERGDLFHENGHWHLRGHSPLPQSAMLKLADGRWIGTALIPDFVGAVLVGNIGVDSVSYLPVPRSRFASNYNFDRVRDAVARAMAFVHQARFNVNRAEASEVAADLRRYKHQNPSLGILAAYAYERAGRIDEIRSIVEWFGNENQPVPFDVAYLARSPLTRVGGERLLSFLYQNRHYPVAGSFPLLTQGWALLNPGDGLHPALRAVLPDLLPALWTTLRDKGGRTLADAVYGGEL